MILLSLARSIWYDPLRKIHRMSRICDVIHLRWVTLLILIPLCTKELLISQCDIIKNNYQFPLTYFMSDFFQIPTWPLLASALALLVPLGLVMLIAEDRERPQVAGVIFLAGILASIVGYAATGFAIHFGGIGILIDHPDVTTLVWEWTPLKEGDLALWGVAGWMGFGLSGVQTNLAAILFLSAIPALISTVILILSILRQRSSLLGSVIFASIFALLLAPLVGNWIQGGGWLMHLGQSMGAGDGYLDFGGASFFLLVGGAALAALLARRPKNSNTMQSLDAATPALGLGLILVGSAGWLLASPLHLWGGSSPGQGVLSGLLAMAAGGIIGLAYSWFIMGEPDSLWISRSAVAGWVAVLAVIPWTEFWQAMLIGAVAAWLYIIFAWITRVGLSWRDPGDGFGTFGLPAIWGLLAVGILAPAPGQMRAQAIGIISIFLLAFFPTSLYFLVGQLFSSSSKQPITPSLQNQENMQEE